MADTGAGHRAAARALEEALAEGFPGRFATRSVDPLAVAPWPVRAFGPGYARLVRHLPRLYGLGWHLSNHALGASLMHRALRPLLTPALRRIYAEARPEMVISVHPLLTQPALQVLRAGGSSAPFVTVVTDLFDAHATWFRGDADRLVVPTQGAAALARRLRVPERRIRVLGQPIRPVFARPAPDRAATRRALGLEPARPTVLLMGGGDGVGRLPALARAIAEASPALQLVVIAGRNRALAERLRQEDWPVPVRVAGFVDNMAEWMFAADVLVTKAGPGSLMEALAAGLPILLHGHLPGQEAGNVRYVLEAGLGAVETEPAALAQRVASWLAPERAEALAEMRLRARAAARPAAALDIAGEIASLAPAPRRPSV